MENIEIFEITTPGNEPVTYVIIDRGNGEFTSMPKSVWDELQAKQAEGGLI
jgi:hypothetical protein